MRPSDVRIFEFVADRTVTELLRGTTRREDGGLYEYALSTVVAARALVVLLIVPRFPMGVADTVLIVFVDVVVFLFVGCALFNI